VGTEPVWWLLPGLQLPGDLQMALDQWLLEQHRLGVIPPCLRFYRWSRPTLSLGHHQHRWPADWAAIPGLDWVRRPSGGRAVLHSGRDLTYALVGSGWGGDRRRAYAQLCGFLIAAFRDLGEPLSLGHQPPRGDSPNCFARATAADLTTAAGLKRIGSAQTWQGDCLLQHGEILLGADAERWRSLFGEAPPAPGPTIPQVEQALTEAVRVSFGIRLEPFPGDRLPWDELLARRSRFVLDPMTVNSRNREP